MATTLTDPRHAPAKDLVWWHACRWQGSEMVARLCARQARAVSLRSRTEAGVAQEIWALLSVYQILARPLVDPEFKRTRRIRPRPEGM